LLRGRTMEKVELARLCQRAENQFVGMPCGIMDQYVSVFGQEHAAVKIDCRSLQHEIVTLPGTVEIVATNTMVKHELSVSAYRQRVAECKAAVDAIAVNHPEVELLRDARLDWIEPADSGIPDVPRKRARHIVSEDIRVKAFLDASNEGNIEKMGRLFTASHRSLQYDYEVSCEELDFLVDEALKAPGVLGSRMTGGGFGGCTVTLLRPGNQEAFRGRLSTAYKKRFGLTPQFCPVVPAAGAGEA
jgi:galactokinase